MRPIKALLSIPLIWDLVQRVLGANEFKRELYLSKLHPPLKILDFGCADGHIADMFSAFDYHGVDIDPVAIEAAQKRFRHLPNMHFVAADLCDRPFKEGEFDAIVFAGTIHHLDDGQLRKLLPELDYCLKPDGVIHVFDLVRQKKDGWSQKLMRRLDQGQFTRSLPEIISLIESPGMLECGDASLHTPYGALVRDCDVVYMQVRKKSSAHKSV
jgi:SAM-dependent methyltransferase